MNEQAVGRSIADWLEVGGVGSDIGGSLVDFLDDEWNGAQLIAAGTVDRVERNWCAPFLRRCLESCPGLEQTGMREHRDAFSAAVHTAFWCCKNHYKVVDLK
ncbi:hypothetical protein [Massilia glaciei]|uniref:hypothetical protein n=1 Tax=Massilia glaciei TaxID=1524097 RepID=UPI0011B2183A|nr:hypothetical protein [Massilia glaciei]